MQDTCTAECEVFYFIEVMGGFCHYGELGECHKYLFIGNVLRCDQKDGEYRQTSSSCPWFPLIKYEESESNQNSPFSSVVNLAKLFEESEARQKSLTVDFCPWSATDGLGIHDLFGSLFFRKEERNGVNFTCFLDDYDDDDTRSCSDCISRLFNFGNSVDEEEIHIGGQNRNDVVISDGESGTDISSLETTINSDSRSDNSPSSASAVNNEEEYSLMRDCTGCLRWQDEMRGDINMKLEPQWQFFFKQTRWSIRFAPQQQVDVSMKGIHIPPWRCSLSRMMLDVARYCKKNGKIRNLILLDPMVSCVDIGLELPNSFRYLTKV